MNFKEKILNNLIDKYERSKQSYDPSTKGKTIFLSVEKDPLFKSYWAEDHYLYRGEIEADITALEQLNYVSAIYSNDLLKKVNLNIDKLADIYSYLKREPKSEKGSRELAFIERELTNEYLTPIAKAFLQKMKSLLESHSAHDSYFKDIDELALYLNLLLQMEKNDEEILLRNFSKKYFKDSKLIEKNSAKLLRLFSEFSETQYTSFSELCATCYIEKNSGYAYIKNGICFRVNDQIIDLDKLGTDFALNDDAIDAMEIIQINASKVYTIENLTTFHYFNENDSIIIYLGGYHNRIKRKLLQKIHSYQSTLQWFHIGDIDWGGFEIFMHLVANTGIDFQPYMMNINELEKYKDECLPLTQNDKRKLELLLTDEKASIFHPVIKYMLLHNYKLEQESLVF